MIKILKKKEARLKVEVKVQVIVWKLIEVKLYDKILLLLSKGVEVLSII